MTADGVYGTRLCHAEMPSQSMPVPSPETTHSAHQYLWLGHSGGPEAHIAAGVAARQNLSEHFPWKRAAGQWMHCAKLLCQSLIAQGFNRHVAGGHVRIAILHRFNADDSPVTKDVG
ncbi:hypothetical protein GCM10022290_04980 [Sagittula marina]